MKTYTLKLLAAIAIAGVLRSPKDSEHGLVDADERLAKNLLHRNKARMATAEDLKAAGREVPSAASDEASATKPSDGLSVPQLKAALDAKNITYPADAKKADLAALLDAAPAA